MTQERTTQTLEHTPFVTPRRKRALRVRSHMRRIRTTHKERPKCRQFIEERNLRPHLLRADDGTLVWGDAAIGEDGVVIHLNEKLPRQMENMMAEGYWGEEAMSAVANTNLYWDIRDSEKIFGQLGNGQ